METHYIRYDGKEYEVKEPTISKWHELMLRREFEDDDDFNLSVIETITGLSRDEIRQAPAEDIRLSAAAIANYIMTVDTSFHDTFTFNDITYKFIELDKITFGEFVDIDTFLTRPDSVKSKEMNLFMALLYRPMVEGKIVPYNPSEVAERAELFKDLPVKYLNGATTFFLRIGVILSDNTHSSSQAEKAMGHLMEITSVDTGGGIQVLSIWLMKTYLRYLRWLKSRWLKLSTFLHINLTTQGTKND